MDRQMILELVGYLSSVIVLISFLMTSVVKLRVINSVGSLIFTVYALLIHSYPTAFLNACLIGVNIYNLIRLTRTDKHYSLIKEKSDDAYLSYFLDHYREDIAVYFPGADTAAADRAWMVCCDEVPVGVLLGRTREEGTLEILLDYSTQKYRDCSVGAYLYAQLKKCKIRRLVLPKASDRHAGYLKKMGFRKEAEGFVKMLE